MSVEYEVLIKTSRSHEQVAAGLFEFTGVRFERSSRPDELEYSAYVFGRWMSLFDMSGFEDHNDIVLTQYQYYLSIDRGGNFRHHPDGELWHEQIASMIACALTGVYADECVVMREFQSVLARFHVAESAPRDVVAFTGYLATN